MKNAGALCSTCLKDHNHGTAFPFRGAYGRRCCAACGKPIAIGEQWAFGLITKK